MARKTEGLSGGLITGEDPAFLRPGQLSDIRNLVYRNGGRGLERATGRQTFGSASAAATGVPGLRDFHFDNGDHYLVAQVGGLYRIAPVGVTGTFADLASIASGTSLEVVQFRNRFFLLNGASAEASAIGSNLVVYLSATATGTAPSTRNHGLLPVIAAPNATTAAGAFSQPVTGYYEYWTTEVQRVTQDGAQAEIESAFSSDNGVTTVTVSATSVVPTIQRPTLRNEAATVWRIYRSAAKTKFSDKAFPIGFMIAEFGTGVSAHADTTAVASASSFPATFASGSEPFAQFASASSMASDNGAYASGTVAPPGANFQKSQAMYNFSFGGFVGAVKGITVEVQGYVQSGAIPMPVEVTVGRRRPDGNFWQYIPGGQNGPIRDVAGTKSGLIVSTNSAAPTTFTLGSSEDRWFPTDAGSLSDIDFDTQLMVRLRISNPTTGTSVGIDYVKVTVFYGASIDSTVVYPTVVYTFGDINAQVSKNFPAPSSNTGDEYEDCLVLNDVSNPGLIRYSFPGTPEYFPPTYFLDFETKENDRVRLIRVVNNRLVVGLDTSLWRVNYLTSERDSSFDRGKATNVISRSIGIPGPMLATTFTIDGQTEQLAFVSHKGIHTTDGFNFISRMKNQDWRRFISLTATSTPIALLNDPENRCLRFYFRNDSSDYGNETFLCLHLSYDPADIDQEGNFKVSGPVHMRNYSAVGSGYASLDSAWAVPLGNGDTGIYLGYGGTSAAAGAGKVYYETGTAIPANDPEGQWTSRRIYGAGISAEWMLDDLYGYCGDYSGAPLLIYTFLGTKTNDAGETNRGTKQITLGGQKLHKVTPKIQSEGLRIKMQTSGAGTFRQEMIVLGSTDFGIEDSGR